MKTFIFSLAILCLSSSVTLAQSPSSAWQEGVEIPPGGRPNPFNLSEPLLSSALQQGRLHAQIYPVEVTGLLPPYEPFKRFFESEPETGLSRGLRSLFQRLTRVKSFDDVFQWIGLHPYPATREEGVYQVPYPNGIRPETRLGLSLLERDGAVGFTLSCATCHSSNLFGKTVLGLTNRFPRANEAFRAAITGANFYNLHGFQAVTKATPAEVELMSRAVRNLRSVGAQKPLTLGLDTSLAQVALSLSRRNLDGMASKNSQFEASPRKERLASWPADSKPAVWWNLKYKNRWLSDGSVISGNPVFTNILWNEIGRGADLREIDQWLKDNPQIITELTTAVFSSEAPRFTDFFDAESFDLPLAKEGQVLFNGTCAKCHGVYEKAWDQPHAFNLSKADQLKTTLVRYHKKTPVIDIGTDPMRYLGMTSLAQLNQLDVSKNQGTIIKPQVGYVPPPLVGIWARWPYFHNNSAPSLCAVLTRGEDRPSIYYSGEAIDPNKDFDQDCNGYPMGTATPRSWKTREHRYDTRRTGMSRLGHDEKVFLKDGQELFSPHEKKAIIKFLQTL